MGIIVENIETSGWQAAIRGMRNPKNSWSKSDSKWEVYRYLDENGRFREEVEYKLGSNDLSLATTLIKGGSEHRKFLRMVHVSMDITADLAWWKEMDTYKIATTRNSCSTMHKLTDKPLEIYDFAHEGCDEVPMAHDALISLVDTCEQLRLNYKATGDRKYWRALIELLPESYMQKATWDGNMETILNIMHQRHNHKMREEWQPFIEAIEKKVPYAKTFYDALYGKQDSMEDNNAQSK